MSSVEILRVTMPATVPEELLGFFVDEPAATLEQGRLEPHPLGRPAPAHGRSPGREKVGFVVHIRGWVVGRVSRAVSVEVLYQGRVIRLAPIRGVRDDLPQTARESGDAVFHALVGVLGLSEEFELELRAVLEDGTRAAIGSVRARHRPLGPQLEPRVQPITLTTLGRSGSTWVMAILAEHPEIVVYRRYPYEACHAKYWTHMLKVLSEPSNLLQSTDTHMFHENLWWIGHNPYFDDAANEEGELGDWLSEEHILQLARLCQSSIDDWYATVARRQGQEPPRYFAEKHIWPNYTPVLLRELYPAAKEVFLVRDFRDMASSILAFDQKRGYAGFQRPPGRSDAQYVQTELAQAAADLLEGWRSRHQSAHLVRYEDMVSSPVKTIASLLDYIGVDASELLVADLLAKASQSPGLELHRTSSSLETSIGRWRREGDESFSALYAEAFSEPLAAFGYLDHGSAPAAESII
jgi:hypothetical protein